MTILITGATGNVGSELVRALRHSGVSCRAMVRGPDLAAARERLGEIELVQADFDDGEAVARALDGVDRAFLLTPSSERAEAQQCGFVEIAARQGVRRIVKLSQYAADAASPVRFLRYHAAAERAIRASGIAYTFLRPNLFMQGLLAFRETIAAKAMFFAAAGDAAVSVIDVRDIAAVAAAALLDARHDGATYDLTGPAALTHAEIAAQLGRALGRSIAFIDISPEAMRSAFLDIGVPPWQADGVLEDYAHYRRGEAATVATGVADALGKPPRSFADFARDHASAFV